MHATRCTFPVISALGLGRGILMLKRTLFALFALLVCGLGVASIALTPSGAIAGDDTETSGSGAADGGGDGGGPGAPAPESGGGDGGGPGAPDSSGGDGGGAGAPAEDGDGGGPGGDGGGPAG